MSANQIMIALLAGAFQAYIIYRLMHIFFAQASRWGKGELVSYALYWAINSAVYIGCNHPVVAFASSGVLYYLLSRQYSDSRKRRTLSIVLALGLVMLAEAIITIALSVFGFGFPYEYDDTIYLISQFAVQTISYMMVLLYKNMKSSQNNIEIPNMYWCATILVPASTLFIAITFSLVLHNRYIYLMMICAFVMLCLNIMAFYLYDGLQKEYQEKLDNEMLAQQNKLDNEMLTRQNEAYVNEFNLVADSNARICMIRHNTINHVIVLRKLISQSRKEEALQYMARVESEITADEADQFRTGNLIVDSILNAKLSAIQQDHIVVERQINIPDKLAIEPFDLGVIIGNLMDNAIEAVRQLPQAQRQIKLQLTYDGSALYLFSSNPCDPELEVHDSLIVSTKEDQENHGLGLKSVYRSVARYSGSLPEIYTEGGWFCADIMLYEPPK